MHVGSDSLESLIMARRLLLLNHQIENHRKDPTVEAKSFKEIIEGDEIHLSGGMETSTDRQEKTKNTGSQDTLDSSLSDLSRLLKESKSRPSSLSEGFSVLNITKASPASSESE